MVARVLLAPALVAPLLYGIAQPATAVAPTYVSLTFDDGRESQATIAGPEMASRNIPGTFYLNSGTIGSRTRMTWAQATALAAAGNEIGGHTTNHKDLTDPTLTYDQAVQQVCADRQTLIAQGLAPSSFAYPTGAWNRSFTLPDGTTKTARDVVSGCGYGSGRAAGGVYATKVPYAETLPPGDLYATKTQEGICVPNATNCELLTAAKLKNQVTATAGNGGGWVQFGLHEVCADNDNPCLTHTWRPISRSEFAIFLDWLAASGQPGGAPTGTSVKTVRDVIALPPPQWPAYRDTVLSTPGLQSYWRLGETAGTAAVDSVNGATGTYVNGVVLGRPGAISNDLNTSVGFNGTSHKVALPAAAPVTDFTLEAWSNLANATTANNALYGAVGSVRLLARAGAPVMSTGMYAGVWLNGVEYVLQPSTGVSNVNKWVAWVLTRQGGTMTLYRNGVKVGQRTDLPAAATANLSGWIGSQGGNSYFLAGGVDDVSIYNRALSPVEVSEHYKAGTLGVAPA
jgi:peptidoglycan/xylan/chitin deacetylase (PgdA/CDA1 family)